MSNWNPITMIASVMCAMTGGHELRRSGDYEVCDHCGHRVRVKRGAGR